MKIGIYGGTFDPPHLGHMEAARAALAQMNLDRLLIIPDREPPHKDLAEEAASPQQRLAMAALMADGLGPRAEASDLELRREGKSYTADTVEAIHEAFPEDELWLLMGTDMFLTIQNWYQPERIFQYAGVAAFSRSQEDTQEIFAQQSQYLEETYHAPRWSPCQRCGRSPPGTCGGCWPQSGRGATWTRPNICGSRCTDTS